MSTQPEIELLWWEGCPSTEHAREQLRVALEDLGLDGAVIRMVEVQTDEQAQALGFRGSPTILIDGVDLTDLSDPEIRAGGHRTRGGARSATPQSPDGAAKRLRDLHDGEASAPAPASLTCRGYRRRDGRISPTPDPEDLRDALSRAAQRQAHGVAGSPV